VRKYIDKAFVLARSQSAKDTYVLFVGNILGAFTGFVFTLIIARGLSVGDFGVFSAVNNLIIIIASLADIGISAALVSFVASYQANNDTLNARRYLKSSLIVRLLIVSVISLALLAFAPWVSKNLLVSEGLGVVYWSIILSYGLFFLNFFSIALQAYKRFIASVSIDLIIGFGRILAVGAFFIAGLLTLNYSFLSFTIGAVITTIVGFMLLGTAFLKVDTPKEVYVNLLKFSGWVGVNRIISAISGRLDVQMLAIFSGAEITGQYSIAQRLALFITVLISSLSAVMAPRLAAFGDKEKEKKYLLKATLVTLPIIAGVLIWIVIAGPFISLLFGSKYLPAIPIFKMFAASLIPFILAAIPVSAIIYSIKKPIYIGYFSFFQLAVIFLINFLLIPKIGPYGPLVAYFVVNISLALYSWYIVYRYYWR